MRTTTTVALTLVRITGAIQIILGILFWTGNALSLIPVHIVSGLILVLSLWTLAILALRAGVPAGFPIVALLWGVLTVLLGITQGRLLVSSWHWVVQIVHLLVGLVAIGQAHGLAFRIRRIIGAEIHRGQVSPGT